MRVCVQNSNKISMVRRCFLDAFLLHFPCCSCGILECVEEASNIKFQLVNHVKLTWCSGLLLHVYQCSRHSEEPHREEDPIKPFRPLSSSAFTRPLCRSPSADLCVAIDAERADSACARARARFWGQCCFSRLVWEGLVVGGDGVGEEG